jgi:hypothetical protein
MITRSLVGSAGGDHDAVIRASGWGVPERSTTVIMIVGDVVQAVKRRPQRDKKRSNGLGANRCHDDWENTLSDLIVTNLGQGVHLKSPSQVCREELRKAGSTSTIFR